MIREGLRRLSALIGAGIAGVAVVGVVAGVAVGGSIVRTVAVAYMLVGAVLVLVGAGASMARARRRPDAHEPFRARSVDSMAGSAVLLAVGVALVVLGIVLDPRSKLF